MINQPDPQKTDNIVCPKCKKEANFKGSDLLDVVINDNIYCIFCGETIVSCRPEVRPPYVYTGNTNTDCYCDYD